jgi:hypothetical protein
MASPWVRRARRRAVAAVLRTPLHPTLSRRFVLLRRVGDAAVDPPLSLRCAEHDGSLILLPPEGDTWWTALPEDGTPVRCEVRRRGQVLDLPTRRPAGEALDEAVLRYLQRHPGEWRRLGVSPQADEDEVAAAARSLPVVVASLAPTTTPR